MIHQRQRLPLRLEARDDVLRVHAELDDLERDPAADRFLLLGHVNHAAAAFADLLKQLVSANDIARFFPGQRGQARSIGRRLLHEIFPALIGGQQQFHPLTQRGVIHARLLQIGGALLRRQPRRSVKNDFFLVWQLAHATIGQRTTTNHAPFRSQKDHTTDPPDDSIRIGLTSLNHDNAVPQASKGADSVPFGVRRHVTVLQIRRGSLFSLQFLNLGSQRVVIRDHVISVLHFLIVFLNEFIPLGREFLQCGVLLFDSRIRFSEFIR